MEFPENIEALDEQNSNNPNEKRSLTNLDSYSVPNTSFLDKLSVINKDGLGNEFKLQSSSYPSQGQASISQQLKTQLGNSNLSDIENGNSPNVPSQQTRISLQEEGRVPRVDVLWKIRDEESPENDASIADFRSEYGSLITTNKKQCKVFPSFNKKVYEDVPTPPSQTVLDPSQNGDLRIVQKKSDEQNGAGIHEKSGHRCGDVRLPPGKEPLERRERFNWPWHRGTYRITYHFQNPNFRNEFSRKMLMLKILQWTLIILWTFAAKHIQYLYDLRGDFLWTFYCSMFTFTLTYLAVRSLNVSEATSSSCLVMSIYTISLSHICAVTYVSYDAPIIVMILLTLIFTYSTICLLSYCVVVDSQKPSMLYMIVSANLIYSICAFFIVVLLIHGYKIQEIPFKLASVWLPGMLATTMLGLVEIAEIQGLTEGEITPLTPNDWIYATTFLL